MIYRTYKQTSTRPVNIEFFYNEEGKRTSIKRGAIEINLDPIERARLKRMMVAVDEKERTYKIVK